MRDIRGDLQERAKLLDEEIGATQDQFDKIMEHLKLEHQRKTEDLKSDLDAVQMVIKTEDYSSAAPQSYNPRSLCRRNITAGTRRNRNNLLRP